MNKYEYEKLRRVYWAQMALVESMGENYVESERLEGMRQIMLVAADLCTNDNECHRGELYHKYIKLSTMQYKYCPECGVKL